MLLGSAILSGSVLAGETAAEANPYVTSAQELEIWIGEAGDTVAEIQEDF